MSSINLSDEAIRDVTAKALLDHMTPQVREDLIKQAIQHLLAPDYDRYSRGVTPLQEAFNRASRDVVESLIRQRVEEDAAFKEQLDSLWRDAWAKVIADRDALVEKMAKRIASAIEEGRDRY